MKKIIFVTLLSLLLAPYSVWSKQLYVVVNKHNSISQLTKKQVTDIYMGRAQYFSNGSAALKIDAPGSSNLRQSFYENLVEMTLPAVNAYWARLMFSGRATPPMQVPKETDVIQLVKSNPNAIGYIPEGELNQDVKVVFSIQVD
jgi:ABC-type phosphate transport system substrate-binding protein